MNTVAVNCPGCHKEVRATEKDDGTYLMICTNLHCKRRGCWTAVMLGECNHCTAPITAYEQPRIQGSKLPRMFSATCWNDACKRRGHTGTRTLEPSENIARGAP